MKTKDIETRKIWNEWDNLPVEERKRRVKVRMSNLGKYKNILVVNNPNLLGQ